MQVVVGQVDSRPDEPRQNYTFHEPLTLSKPTSGKTQGTEKLITASGEDFFLVFF